MNALSPPIRLPRWLTATILLALLLAGGVAWINRPLNAVERQLVGVWLDADLYDQGIVNPFWIRSDRKLGVAGLPTFPPSGSWRADPEFVTFRPRINWHDPWNTTAAWMQSLLNGNAGRYRILDVKPDQLVLSSETTGRRVRYRRLAGWESPGPDSPRLTLPETD